jgi:predicted dienelactone hydrolase
VAGAATMIRMTNYQSFSRRRVLGVGLAASLLVSTPALAQAYPVGEPDGGPSAGAVPGAATAATYPPVTIDVPAPTGPGKIGTIELHLVDRAREDASAPGGSRELMVSVWYPARSGGEGPVAKYMPPKTSAAVNPDLSKTLGVRDPVFDFARSETHARVGVPAEVGKHPVVLFSPGYSLSRFYSTAQVEELASRGYVVVTIDHTHEGPVEFPAGRFVPGTEVLVPTADQTKSAIDARVADTRFVLDQLTLLAHGLNPDAERRKLPRGLRQALDVRTVGMFGFSEGGHTTANAMDVDRRIKAGLDLDGTLAYDMQAGPIGPGAQHGLDRPFLLFGSDGSQRTDPGSKDNYDPSWAALWKNQQGWKANLQLPGARHLGLSDYQFFYFDVVSKLVHDEDLADQIQANIAGVVDRKRALLAQRTYLTAFFDQTLRGRTQPLLRGESRDFPEITFVR